MSNRSTGAGPAGEGKINHFSIPFHRVADPVPGVRSLFHSQNRLIHDLEYQGSFAVRSIGGTDFLSDFQSYMQIFGAKVVLKAAIASEEAALSRQAEFRRNRLHAAYVSQSGTVRHVGLPPPIVTIRLPGDG